MKKIITLFLSLLISTSLTYAEDKVELKMTYIRGNKELPQILYLVSWQDTKNKKREEQNLVLHSLFGDLFDPVSPESLHHPMLSHSNN